MADIPIKVGDIVSNSEMTSAFKVGNMGGMRRSKALNCLVLISDHTKGLYEDKWHGDALHYTGMGKVGDQELVSQNRTLYESPSNGVEIHLFEVINPREYTYHGVVELCDEPYQEIQKDVNGNDRNVWMFPIKPVGKGAMIPAAKLEAASKRKQKRAKEMSADALRAAAEGRSTETPGRRRVSGTQIERDEFVSEFAKRCAAGVCALCELPAPFNSSDGTPYLETHHVIWLSEGGSDSIDNTVALCPNCHRKMHIVKDPDDVEKLKQVAESNAL